MLPNLARFERGKKMDVKMLYLVEKIRCLRRFRRLFRDGCPSQHANQSIAALNAPRSGLCFASK